jgi:hypothetical protein
MLPWRILTIKVIGFITIKAIGFKTLWAYVMFSSNYQLMIDIFPNVITHVKEKDVIFFLVLCVACIVSFNLWMSCAKCETFAMVVNNSWEPTHVIVDVFEVHNQPLQPWPSRLRFCLILLICLTKALLM